MFTKKITLIALLTLGCFTINAQEQDPKAKKILCVLPQAPKHTPQLLRQ